MAVAFSPRVLVRPALPQVGALATAGVWLDLLLVGSMLLLAGAVRWPYLLLSPQFPSVGQTVLRALDVAAGRAFYLTDAAPYLGAPFVWLLAAVYAVVGPSVQVTMLVAWALGTLTIVPTYLLGREAGGRLTGLVAAALLATSGAHTVITSHVPLSHSLTPLVATTTLWLLARAVRLARRPQSADARSIRQASAGGRLLALAGLLAGLTLQTHPTAAPLLIGAALTAILARPAWLRTRWPAVAVALVVLGYSTLLVYHVTSRFEVVGDIESKQARYLDADDDREEDPSRGVYANNLEQLLLSVTRMTSGAIAERETRDDYLLDPWVVGYVGLALAGLAVAARRGHWWLVGGIAVAMLLPPSFSGKYRPIMDGRYLMPLVPVLFVAVGLVFGALVRLIAPPSRRPSPARQVNAVLAGRQTQCDGSAHTPSASTTSLETTALTASLPVASKVAMGSSTRSAGSAVPAGMLVSRGLALAAVATILGVVVTHPLQELARFYEESQEDGFSNARYFRTLAQVEASWHGAQPVLLDPRLRLVKSAGGGNAGTNFDWLLAVEGVKTDSLEVTLKPADLHGRLAILQRDTADRLDQTLTLTPLDGRTGNSRERPSYRAYRIDASAAMAAQGESGER
ncbi:MAG: glycosyltransferase family 39 protein [Chloroflexi bacterium]|nr:glycosyltransferase family 39 protein [Chloroflexota bacterium]